MDNRILVTQSSMPFYEEYIEEIKSIWDTKWLTNMGPKHNEFEKQLIQYLKLDNVSLFNNGHLALMIAIKVLGLKGEVITTPFTFASTTHALVDNGLTPVFCDINQEDYTIDVNKIECLITEKTTAIMPVHVYGNVCDIKKISEIAKKYNLKVIYDAAHTFGVEYKNKGIGSYGDISMFSFHATKVFNTIEGGCLAYNNTDLKEKISILRNFGIKNQEEVTEIGTNAKMNEFQACMGICNLRNIDKEIEKRQKVVERYRENLNGMNGIKLTNIQKDVKQNYAYFPIVFDNYKHNRDEICDNLAKENIFARKYFYPLTNSFSCYDFDVNKTPIALNISKNVLTLPLYADLTLDTVDKICKIILED